MPFARWFACLVPAFDAGVRRGLGQQPVADQPLGPAWSDEADITLPLYFHWEFSTGPAGDFESLARRLSPFTVTDAGNSFTHVDINGNSILSTDMETTRLVTLFGSDIIINPDALAVIVSLWNPLSDN